MLPTSEATSEGVVGAVSELRGCFEEEGLMVADLAGLLAELREGDAVGSAGGEAGRL